MVESNLLSPTNAVDTDPDLLSPMSHTEPDPAEDFELVQHVAGAIRDYEAEKDDAGHTLNREFADVLLIVTGGTLCMVHSDHGYVTAHGLGDRLKKNQIFYDADFCKENNVEEDWLVTPPTPYKHRIRFKVLEFDNLLDSSNLNMED